ncbi:MAG: SIS domain-containing protein [Candidatus Marsarchaeota archaeon]|nr:SIS domain-containing protein [Candidatus Marsarchaeota archaeon]
MDEKKFVADLEDYIERSVEVAKEFKKLSPKLKDIAMAIENAAEQGASVYIMGNGGSAATASHMVADLNKTAIREGKKRFRAICLNDNVPVMMAWANDDSYDSIFVEQLKNFLAKGDILIGISGSGNSPNVVKAIEYANGMGNTTIGITGMINEAGGKLGKMAKIALIVPDNLMYRLEDFHLMVNHALVYAFKHNDERQ